MTYQLLARNSKISASSGGDYEVFNFGIPAYRSQSGMVTCPMAGSCGKSAGCYAQQSSYTWAPVRRAYERRLAATLRKTFGEEISAEIGLAYKYASKKRKRLAIRIHDSGDFYSTEYRDKWLEVIRDFDGVQFYAYTKSVHMFNGVILPDNFTVIYSEGGKLDKLHVSGDRHARVFPSHSLLVAAGYDDATTDDTVAFRSKSGRIGLVYHGYKSREWTTTGGK